MASANADQSALVPVPAVGSIGGALMPFRPPAPVRARAKRKALGEEAFVSGLERIITRDFFPQLAKLRAQQEWVPTSPHLEPASAASFCRLPARCLPLWNLLQRQRVAVFTHARSSGISYRVGTLILTQQQQYSINSNNKITREQ